jgi:hypothetical protein
VLSENKHTRDIFWRLQNELGRYYGQDVTALYGAGSFATFKPMMNIPQLITAHIRRPATTVEITRDELQENSSLDSSPRITKAPPTEDATYRRPLEEALDKGDVWVSVKNTVYDVTGKWN